MTSGLPLWQDGPYASRPPLVGGRDVDVCVIGAGVGGLSTAWHLAARGTTSLVVEARTVASGASGRNGGFFIAGPAPMYNDARRELPAGHALRIYRATLAAQEELYALAARLGAARSFRRAGMLRLAWDEREAAHVRDHAAALAEDGLPGRIVEEAELPAAVRRPGRLGLFTDHDSGFQPADWLRRLAVACEDAGATIVEGSPVTAPIERGDDGRFVLETPEGHVRAQRVVVAADAHLGILVPAYADLVRCTRLHMVATAPVAERLLPCCVYARDGWEYFHQLDDGRVALGGFRDIDTESVTTSEAPSPVVMARLERYLVEELGVSAPVTHRWVGLVGFTDGGRPFVGESPDEPGLYVAGGYCGTGNINGWVAGRIVADLIADGASPDADLFDAARLA